MIHVGYDSFLVFASVFAAICVSFIAVSIETLVFNDVSRRYEKYIVIASGLVLGFAIWLMHYIGIVASQLPEKYDFHVPLTILSYIIAAISSTFAIWLCSRETLPLPRLIIGSVLMGLGISGMHYTGMVGLIIPRYLILYDPIIVVLSVVVAILGSAISLKLTFIYKVSQQYKFLLKIAISVMLALAIIGMHYIGMYGTYFVANVMPLYPENYKNNHELMLFTMIMIAMAVLLIGLFIAILEKNLEQKNFALLALNRKLENHSKQDYLTKVLNRSYLNIYERTFNLSTQMKETVFLYLDLDAFKSVNDAFGHYTGDKVLLEVVNRIHSLLDTQKFVRLGGDEFLIIAENYTIENSIDLANQLLKSIEKKIIIEQYEINISLSIGIAAYPSHGRNIQELLTNADFAMLTAKQKGRNSYYIFNYSLDVASIKNQSQIVNELKNASEENQFILFYQPKYHVSGKICGVEALIRWQHPQKGIVSPAYFIHVAESFGLIIEIGYWVLEEGIRQIQVWERQQRNEFFPLAINLSALQFEHKYLMSTLEGLLLKYQILPEHLTIEITETTAIRYMDVSLPNFFRLRELGIHIAIDDFGTGYSSFSYLKDLPVDELKIDREFIVNLAANSKEEIILASIIELAQKLGLTVTAEGVESKEQADILKRLGCEQLQGYLFAKPMPVEQLEQHTLVQAH